MDNLLDFLSGLPMIPLCRGILAASAVLMLVTLLLIRLKQPRLAGGLAVLALVLGVGSTVRLATWKEPTPCTKYLAATQFYDRVAIQHLADIIRQQYPRHQVIVLLPPEGDLTSPESRVVQMATLLGPQTKLAGACIKPDEHTVDEVMACYKATQPNLPRAQVQQNLASYMNDWYGGRYYTQALKTAGLTGDIVVVSFAGLPHKDIAEVKAAGHPVLLPPTPGNVRPDIVSLIEDGVVTGIVLSQPGSYSETRLFRNLDKAFSRRWFLLTKASLAEARKIPQLLPEPTLIDPPAPAKN